MKAKRELLTSLPLTLVEGEKRIIFLLKQILQQVFALVQDSIAHRVGEEGRKNCSKMWFLKSIPAQQVKAFSTNSLVREGPSSKGDANWKCGEMGSWFPALPRTSWVTWGILLAGGAIHVMSLTYLG